MSTLTVDIRLRLSSSFLLDCAFHAPPGFTVLFGPSGAGKTSVLDCLAGVKAPESGRIAVEGHVIFDRGRGVNLAVEKRRLAYVFQSLALFPHMTVEENVNYGLHGEERKDRKSSSMLEQFGINHVRNRRPGDLSGGERQRVALARSLMTNPRALFLDEPLTALDRQTRMKLVDDLRAWNSAHQVPILYVTHSVREALALGERVLIMQAGRIVATGAPAELIDPEDWD